MGCVLLKHCYENVIRWRQGSSHMCGNRYGRRKSFNGLLTGLHWSTGQRMKSGGRAISVAVLSSFAKCGARNLTKGVSTS